MKFIDQTADQLYLSLFQGPVPREQVHELCSAKLETSFGTIHASIIGASHFFEFITSDGKTIFSEMLACQKLNSIKTFFYERIKNTCSYGKKIEHLDYQFNAQQYDWDDAILSNFMNLYDNNTANSGFSLSFRFPFSLKQKVLKQEALTQKVLKQQALNKKVETVQPQAITMLYALEDNNKVNFHSLHAYPNQKQLVISQTTMTPVKS